LKNSLRESDFVCPKNSILVPIPLHKFRKNWRGFNQSELIGKYLSAAMGWDYLEDLLIRSKYKTPQTVLKIGDRKKNIKGVFTLNPKYKRHIAEYQNLILFDDVYTTGSTMKEAASVVKKAGVEKVYGLVLAG
jgi:ComF family protein